MAKEIPKAVKDVQEKGIAVLELTGDDEDRKYYFKKPGKMDIEKFIATATKGKAARAAKNLVLEMAIHPTSEELTREYEENPGRMVALNNALQASVGMNEEFAAKKL